MATWAAYAALAFLALAAVPAVPADLAGADPSPVYVALGDSYSSGDGIEPYADASACRRSQRGYPAAFADTPTGDAYEFRFIACSGAETRHVLRDDQYDSGTRGGQLSEVREVADSVRLVTITIGGNDARYSEVLHACFASPRSCIGTYADEGDWIEHEVRPRLRETYGALRDAAPGDRTVVLTYPQIFQTDRRCSRDFGIDNDEKQWLRQQTSHLNRVISEEAAGADLEVLDVENAFSGHEICTDEPWANGYREPGPFHPNAAGAGVLADALEQFVR